MRVLITGMDGYLGWALTQYLIARGHVVGGVDNFFRRQWVEEMDSWSAIPVVSMEERLITLKERFGEVVKFWEGDLRNYDFVEHIFQEFQPEAIVHFAECASAPYSSIDVHHAVFVQNNNITTTFNILFAMKEWSPEAQLIKLGTMGEYGTPDLDIPEGFFEVEFRGRKDKLPFPRQAGSWYHWSKVHGSNNVMFACKLWGLKATDVMQGVVFGTHIDEMGNYERLFTRLDFDQAFGTIINRFCCEAVIEYPLTIYGSGNQKRGFLSLQDSMQCLTLILEHPPPKGEYRVFNQFQNVYCLFELAQKVKKVAEGFGLNVQIQHLENPRLELEDHYYQPDHQNLLNLGFKQTVDVERELENMIHQLVRYTDRIKEKKQVLKPDIFWNYKE
ncbi:NAD-dependent epimerase/dehydratase family protein [Chengkuizengella sediminis]|uniref:NAD-dependent epimerase/dehydratase family protein n=1 Tax=Chengkuizengella sediminis TaxID=1885917 RepID=UPI00138969B5|nr:NAD-dependent epimerase/dehydratase family protein [Chengkuizengella sediminis]NDI33557.1 NAD-dependent epimerase/dehydratase family protein [Chengkuizengella sediminis]